MALDSAPENNQRFTRDSTLKIMADYIKGLQPGGSCHTQVAKWIMEEKDLLPTDEIIMFGDTFFPAGSYERLVVAHSAIAREGEIIADPFDTGKYNPDDGSYRFQVGSNANNIWKYEELYRVKLQDFLLDYKIVPPNFDFEGQDPDDGPDF